MWFCVQQSSMVPCISHQKPREMLIRQNGPTLHCHLGQKNFQTNFTWGCLVGHYPTQWTRVWVNSGSWWWTGRPGRAAIHGVAKSWTRLSDWTELNWSLSITMPVRIAWPAKLKKSRCVFFIHVSHRNSSNIITESKDSVGTLVKKIC